MRIAKLVCARKRGNEINNNNNPHDYLISNPAA